MRGITVRHPWAEAIRVGAKNIENRTAGIGLTYRGPLAIHAGDAWSKRGAADPRVRAALQPDALVKPDRVAGYSAHRVLTFGAVIALAECVDIHPAAGCCAPWGEDEYVEAGGARRTNIVHLVLEDIRALTWIIDARGRLGLWHIGDELAADITEAAR